jgi:trehalose 6-phosphate synthase/phosphatase
VNPYDVEGVASSLQRSLSMPIEERRARMKILRRRVSEHDVHVWAREFIEQLQAVAGRDDMPIVVKPEPGVITALTDAQRSGDLRILLDYDGTLVPLARSPELAAPDEELLTLLGELTASPRIDVEIVSGRPRETLESWFEGLPLSIWAEHGFWHRPAPGAPWEAAANVASDWIDRILPILERFTASTPGSLIETKSASLAWHYRGAQREFGARQAHELRMLLGETLSNQPFEVLEGKRVIEVRLRGVTKAAVAHRLRAEALPNTSIVAFGDDRTDEDLFRALPPASLTIAVGPGPTGARFRVNDYRAVRHLLSALVTRGDSGAHGSSDLESSESTQPA